MQDINQPTILVVIHDPFQRRILRSELQRQGYVILESSTGSEAFEIFQSIHTDLVITDWATPEPDGAGLCHRIREVSAVPVIMLTDKGSSTDIVSGFESGADDYLVKPVNANELNLRIRSVLRRWTLFQTYSEQVDSDSLIHHFNFPAQVKVACEQYLLYFVEFLLDIGIDATAELREDAGQVLFSITPKDKDDALDNIREALEIYLRLPMNRNTTVVISPETSIEAQKLSAQIHHLQGQLYLASAALQQQELTIQQQGLIIQQRDATIEQQQGLIQQQIATGRLLVESLQRAADQDDDTEPLGTKLVKVKKLDWERIPIEVDLPELFRILKEKIRRKKLS